MATTTIIHAFLKQAVMQKQTEWVRNNKLIFQYDNAANLILKMSKKTIYKDRTENLNHRIHQGPYYVFRYRMKKYTKAIFGTVYCRYHVKFILITEYGKNFV